MAMEKTIMTIQACTIKVQPMREWFVILQDADMTHMSVRAHDADSAIAIARLAMSDYVCPMIACEMVTVEINGVEYLQSA